MKKLSKVKVCQMHLLLKKSNSKWWRHEKRKSKGRKSTWTSKVKIRKEKMGSKRQWTRFGKWCVDIMHSKRHIDVVMYI